MEKINFLRCRICGKGIASGDSRRFCRLCGMSIADGGKEFCCRECRKKWCKWNR